MADLPNTQQPKQGKKKNQKAKKKKKNTKGKVPMQIFAVPSGFEAGPSEEVDASVQYHKTMTAAFEVKLKDIRTRGGNPRSYDIHMIVPGYGGAAKAQEVLCDLMGSTYHFQNPSPYTLTLRVQRPMGYKDDVSSLAMWEPLGGALLYELKPRSVLKLGSGNGATSHMAPRELVIKGKRVVHLLSISIFREVLSDFANPLTINQIGDEAGCICEIVTRVKTMNGSVGQQECYIIETFEGTDRLNHIVNGPLPKLRFADAMVPQGCVKSVIANLGKIQDADQLYLTFSASEDGSNPTSECDLDKTIMYRMDMGIIGDIDVTGDAICDVVKYDKSGWFVGVLKIQKGIKTFERGTFLSNTPDKKWVPNMLPIETWLSPMGVVLEKSLVGSRTRGGILALQVSSDKMRSVQAHSNLDASIIQSLLKGLVIIYEVTQIAVEILGVVGVLANPELKQSKDIVLGA